MGPRAAVLASMSEKIPMADEDASISNPVVATVTSSPTLADQAYRKISHAIRSGQFGPGEKLTLRGLSQNFDMSSTPIRDAIRKLASENAVDFAPNRYIRIPFLTPTQLRELRDIRVSLEGLATQRAAERIDAAGIARLREIDALARHHRDAGDIAKTAAQIERLHFELYHLSGHDHLVQLIEGLWLRTAPYIGLLFPRYSQSERGVWRRMIIDALEAGETRSARAFIEADIYGALDYIIATVEKGESAVR